ncbi:hypothetical protein B0H34DRAFT_369777 [Crassisporium funariophilum]|nr:hypothetical protein B0H34DRAFT_369777 [Crassisporium funariophilum]
MLHNAAAIPMEKGFLDSIHALPDQIAGTTVDISKVPASDSVQSHLSTANSAKRLRVAVANHSTGLDQRDSPNDASVLDSPARGIAAYIQAFFPREHLALPTTTSGRGSRLERTWVRAAVKYGVLLYCFLSCVTTSAWIFTNISGRDSHGKPQIKFESIAVGSIYETSVGQYLTRMLATTSTTLEPYVLSSNHSDSSVTLCAWSSDLELHSLRKWIHNWRGPVSLLVTTAAAPASISHKSLLKAIRRLASEASLANLSIHILHIETTPPKSPNLYLNLARVFARNTNWTLIYPGDLSTQISPQHLSIYKRLGPSPTISVLTLDGHAYPFQALSPILIPRDGDFWCTERFFGDTSRASDWDECLWQLSLETFGHIDILNAVDNKISAISPNMISEVCILR